MIDFARHPKHHLIGADSRPGAWDAGLIIITDKAIIKDDRVCRMGVAPLGLDRFTCLKTSVKQVLSDYSIRIYYNGETTPNSKIVLPQEELEPDSVFVIWHSNVENEGIGDYFVGNLQFNGNDAVELFRENETIDCIGRIGEDPEPAWTQGMNPLKMTR